MTKTLYPFKQLILPSTGSTNAYAAALLKEQELEEFVLVRALEQTAGKGQKGSSWESEAGKNLTFTLLTKPEFLPLERHFFLSVTASLAVSDFLQEEIPEVYVKWPNDIYTGYRKIAGLLIENSLMQDAFRDSLLGIGININQLVFTSDAPNPVSLRQLTGIEYNLDDCLHQILSHYLKRYKQLREQQYDLLLADYYARLLGYHQWLSYTSGERSFSALIRGVKETGELLMEEKDGSLKEYAFREVTMVLNPTN